MIRFTCLVLFITLLGCESKKADTSGLPNILVLVADDAGWRDFGCYGNPYIKTPNIDFLAENGLKATNAFLTVSQCSPSRISIISGKYPHATGAEDLHMPMPDSLKILPAYLKEKNYYSGLLKKGHFGPNGDKQFDYYNKNLNAFSQFLDSAGTRPFFMWVGFSDPHRPYSQGIIDNPQLLSEVTIPPYLLDDHDTRKDLADYYNEIRRMDSRIGEYIRELKNQSLLQNTLIIFLSDNGAPFLREKGTVYDAGIKTPFILHWPAQITPSETDQLLSLIDLAPSILELVAIPIPSQFQGKPIPGLFGKETIQGRRYIYSERNWHNCDEHIRSIRSEQYKLIKNAYLNLPMGPASDIGRSPSFKSLLAGREEGKLNTAQSLFFQAPRQEYEFYDLNEDPHELYNLVGDSTYNEPLEELKIALDDWMKETNDFPPEQRRRKDNVNRFTGVKFDKTKLPLRPDL